jgi:hypothetical protein
MICLRDKMDEYFHFRYNGPELKASGLLKVDTATLKLGRTLYFGVGDELPKDENEVVSGYDHTFTVVSPHCFEDAVKLRIDWIAWKSKVVVLVQRYEADAAEIFNQLKGVCQLSELENQLEKLKDLPDDWTSSTEDRSKHPIRFIQSLTRRLNIVEQLCSQEQSGGPLFAIGYSGMALFILCTCIESLGRTAAFVPYQDWLEAKRTQDEVEEATKKCSEGDFREQFACVYREYLSRRGVQNAYRSFFYRCIDEKWRQRLAGTIIIYRNEPPDFEPQIRMSIEEVIRYLEDFRHKFAHNLESLCYIPKGMPDSWNEEYAQTLYLTYQRIFPSGAFETIMSMNLLETLTESVRVATWKWICERSADAQRSLASA